MTSVSVARWFLRRILKTFAQYALVVVGGLTAFMILSPIVGYLPYSDRPGPGWHAFFPAFTLTELWHLTVYMTGFASFVLWAAVLYITPVIVLTRVVERFGVRLGVVRAVGATAMGVMTWWIVCGVGWFIAIGLVPVIVATVLAIAYGWWLLPTMGQKYEAPGSAR